MGSGAGGPGSSGSTTWRKPSALDTLEDARRWLRQIGIWAAGGRFSRAVANARVRSVEVWLKTHESKLTRQVVDDLKGRPAELGGQLRERPRLKRCSEDEIGDPKY